MAIKITEDASGRFVLDLSGEPETSQSSGFRDLLFPFSVVTRDSQRFVLDPGDRSAEPLAYLLDGLQVLGYTVVLSDTLRSLYNSYRTELNLMTQLAQVTEEEANPMDVESAAVVQQVVQSLDLLPHQQDGLAHLVAVRNGANFSVQGSGKTAVVLAAFAVWRNLGRVDKLLVIGPVSCFRPWEEEFERCFGRPPERLRWSGSVSQRRRMVPEFQRSELVLCSYDTACRDEEMLTSLLRRTPTLLVLDESHYIKNFDIGARAKAVLRLGPSAAVRVVLTGTPAPHSLYDIWTQFTFLWPHTANRVLGTRRQFQDIVDHSKSPARELRRRLRPFFSRATQSDLGLPKPRVLFPRIAENLVPPEQRQIINLLEVRIFAEAMKLVESVHDWQTLKEWRRARIIRLLQAASNPGLLISERNTLIRPSLDMDLSDLRRNAAKFDSEEIMPAKILWAMNKARELVNGGNKVVIWSSWIGNLRLLSRLLHDLNPLLLFGEIKPYKEESDELEEETREQNILAFRTREDRPILIANPAACAESISLHKECHNAIYVDRTFNCGQFLQSMNRIHRIGLPVGAQTTYWIPILECAIERSVDARLSLRQRVMYDFLGDDAPVVGMEEENVITDTDKELEEAFNSVITEIGRGNEKKDTAEPNS